MHFVTWSDIFQSITLLSKSQHHTPVFCCSQWSTHADSGENVGQLQVTTSYTTLKTTDLSFSLAGYVYIRIRHVAHTVLVEIFTPCCWCEPLKLGANHQG